MGQSKMKTIRFRVSEKENDIIKSNARVAGINQSQYLRKVALNQEILPITDGKEVAKRIGIFQNELRVLHDDVTEQIQTLNDTITENSRLLQQAEANGYMIPAYRDLVHMQAIAINTISRTILLGYNEREKQIQDRVNEILREKKG